MPTEPNTRAGHIALAGAPNAGKSSLLNALVGSHLAIVSPKAQSTRLPVVGLVTTQDTQYVFHDLPGLLDPKYPLHERMQTSAREGLERVHVVLHLHPAADAPAPPFWPLVGTAPVPDLPVLTVYTKTDLISPEQVAALRDGLPISAQTRDGLPELLSGIRQFLPEAPFEFDPDDVGTQPLRFFATEYIREAAFDLLEDEVPYAIAAEVEEFREHTRPVYIRVTLLVERDSQKGIVIGRGGRTLKAIGQHARARLESLLGEQVFLECWVKVLPNWRRNAAALSRLGFPESVSHTS
jgi:GTP-binding protein Era